MNELFRTGLYLPPQASSISHSIDVLHYVVISTALGVAFLSFAAVAYILFRFRDRPGRKPPRFRPGRKLELALAGFTLAVFFTWWCVGFAQYREMHTAPKDPLRIYVVGKQWMWQFVYPNGANAEYDMRIPVGQPIELMLTSRDVIHSFFAPAFRVKQDAIPGRITTLSFTAVQPGIYDLYCAEYCGAGHSRMRGRIIVMQRGDFAKWMNGHTVAEDLASSGEKLSAAYGCFRCHSIDGTSGLGPTWLGLYGASVTLTSGQTVTANDAYLTDAMMDPAKQIVQGYGNVMPSYLGQLGGPEAAAIVEYIHSLERAP